MFDFLHYRKRDEVHRLMSHRVNQACMERMRHGERQSARTGIGEIVFLVPRGERKRPDFAQAIPAIGRDLSVQGLSLIHTAPVEAEDLLVGLQDGSGPRFINGHVQHCTPLGFGFYLIGLSLKEVVNVSEADLRTMWRRLAEFEPAPAMEPAGAN